MTVRKAESRFFDTPLDTTALILLGETEDGTPAIKADLRDYLYPDPVYTDPALIRRMGAEFLQAATYIERQAKKS